MTVLFGEKRSVGGIRKACGWINLCCLIGVPGHARSEVVLIGNGRGGVEPTCLEALPRIVCANEALVESTPVNRIATASVASFGAYFMVSLRLP